MYTLELWYFHSIHFFKNAYKNRFAYSFNYFNYENSQLSLPARFTLVTGHHKIFYLSYSNRHNLDVFNLWSSILISLIPLLLFITSQNSMHIPRKNSYLQKLYRKIRNILGKRSTARQY